MLIALVIILLLIGAAVVGSIYSNFLVFYSNFAESENYHRAYYNAIAALERAELVIKQRQPGFEGNGGWKIGEEKGEGTIADGGSDGIIQDFSYLSNSNSSKNTSTVFRTINSRATRIPTEGNGDVDIILSDTNDSSDYNMMDYNDAQIFLLYYDNGLKSDGTNDNPYNKISCGSGSSSCTQSYTGRVVGRIRLPGQLKDKFNNLNTSGALVVGGPADDAIVDRQIRGKYQNTPEEPTYPFNIYSTQNYFSGYVFNNQDSAIRETDINNDLNFEFGNDKRSPTTRGESAKLTIISQKETEIKSEATNLFTTILNENKYTEKQLRFSLLNLLRTTTNMVYPFLEYYVDFGTEISDKYFTINAEGNYADYKINKLIRKPTNKESVLGSFTSIF